MTDGDSSGSKRRAVGALRAEGKSYREICELLGLSKSTVAYHCRRLRSPADEKSSRRYDWGEIQQAYDSGLTVRECAEEFGFCLASWHAALNRGAVVGRPAQIPLDDLLVVGRTRTNRQDLKARLIKEGLKPNSCEQCGLSEWQGMPLGPQVHHRNGEKHDNRLENIQLLCPNCHALTDTWGGRNRKGRSRKLGQQQR